MRSIVLAVSLTATLLLSPSARAGVLDSPLPTPFTQHVFTVPGLTRVGGFEAFFSCTNLDAVPVTIGVELFNPLGGLGNDAAATSLTAVPGGTVLFGTGASVNISVDVLIGSLTHAKYSARVLATSKKIAWDAFIADDANVPPTSGWPLRVITRTKQKAFD